MDTAELVSATAGLDTDDLVDLLQDLPGALTDRVLASMDLQDRQRIESVLSFAEDTAGGLMDPNVVTVRPELTIQVVLRYLRVRGDLPPHTDALYVVNRDGRYLGLLPLTVLLTSPADQTVAEIMSLDVDAIPVDQTAREVVSTFERKDYVSAPVIGADQRLLGRITVDDVVDEIRDEADRSLLARAGLSEEEDLFAPILASSLRRALWLGINLLTALLAAWVIGLFEATIAEVVALAVLMPIVASMGGIAGGQTVAVVIRGLALGHISARNARALVVRETAIGLLNGLLWSAVVGLIAGLWFGNASIGYVITAAMIINLIAAAFSGAVVPLVLQRIGIDPALAGNVVLTTITDVVGFFAFLGLATVFLL